MESDHLLDQFAQLLDILKPRHYFMYSAIISFIVFGKVLGVFVFIYNYNRHILMVDCVIYF